MTQNNITKENILEAIDFQIKQYQEDWVVKPSALQVFQDIKVYLSEQPYAANSKKQTRSLFNALNEWVANFPDDGSVTPWMMKHSIARMIEDQRLVDFLNEPEIPQPKTKEV